MIFPANHWTDAAALNLIVSRVLYKKTKQQLQIATNLRKRNTEPNKTEAEIRCL